MRTEDLNSQLDALKSKRVELATKVNMTKDPDERESLKEEINVLQKQIDTLEKFVIKR